MIGEAGFEKVEYENLVGGVVAIHSAIKLWPFFLSSLFFFASAFLLFQTQTVKVSYVKTNKALENFVNFKLQVYNVSNFIILLNTTKQTQSSI